MKQPRQLSSEPVRVETGAVQFGNDWPGVFIRGDNAIGFYSVLHKIVNGQPMDGLDGIALNDLADLLISCRVQPKA